MAPPDASALLRTAARRGDSATVGRLLLPTNPSIPPLDPSSPAESAELRAARVAADPNAAEGESGFTALLYAAWAGHHSVLDILLAHPTVDVFVRSKDGKTGLIWSAYRGHPLCVSLLLRDERTEVNARSSSNCTALAYACINNHPACARLLLSDPRVDLESRGLDEKGDQLTPFMFACSNGHTEIVRLFLDSGRRVNWNSRSGGYKRTGFFLACLNGRIDTIRLLLDRLDIIDTEVLDRDGKKATDVCSDEIRELVGRAAIMAGQFPRAPKAASSSTDTTSTTSSRSSRSSTKTVTPAYRPETIRVPTTAANPVPPKPTRAAPKAPLPKPRSRDSDGSSTHTPTQPPTHSSSESSSVTPRPEQPNISDLVFLRPPALSPRPDIPPRPDFVPTKLVDPELISLTSRVLGEGGYGTVYAGHLGSRVVAVKRLRGDSETTRKEFQREVRTWEAVDHQNVLPLLGYSLSPPMIVTELVEDGHLLQYLSSKSYKPETSLRLLLEVATGMHYLHSRNVIHGDLKSRNILVLRSHARICDFGLARVRADVSQSLGLSVTQNGARGTDAFMAPEMLLANARARKATDVYAFGMVCYEVLSRGEKPFGEVRGNPSQRLIQIIRKIEVGERPGRPGGVPDAIWSVVERCWAQEPKERPGFGAVAEELRGVVRGIVPVRGSSLEGVVEKMGALEVDDGLGNLGRYPGAMVGVPASTSGGSGSGQTAPFAKPAAATAVRVDPPEPRKSATLRPDSEFRRPSGPIASTSLDSPPPYKPVLSSSLLSESHAPTPHPLIGKTCRIKSAFSAVLAGQMSVVITDSVKIEGAPQDGWVLVRRVTPRRKDEVGKVPMDRLVLD